MIDGQLADERARLLGPPVGTLPARSGGDPPELAGLCKADVPAQVRLAVAPLVLG